MPEEQLNALVAWKGPVSPRMTILRVVADGWQMPISNRPVYRPGLPGSAPRCDCLNPNIPQRPAQADPTRLFHRFFFVDPRIHRVYIGLIPSGALTRGCSR